MTADPPGNRAENDSFLRFAQERWLLSPEEAQRCLRRCAETGRPAAEVAQELKLLSASVAAIVTDLVAESPGGTSASLHPSSSPDDLLAVVTGGSNQVGRYEVLREVGRGSMAVVYAARDPSMDREVALKVLFVDLGDADDIPRFQRESRAVAQMGRHPNIVDVYDSGIQGQILYYTMELVRGESLEEWLREIRSFRQIGKAGLAVATGLGHAHDHGVIHRDIKPQNILVTEDDRFLISDFGLARPREVDKRLTASGLVLGTPAYMSPEQAQGPENLCLATDVYGLGAVLYEAVTGELPFDLDGVVETLLAKVQNPAPLASKLRPDLPPSFEAIIMCCLHRDPEKRYRDGNALAKALSEWLSEGTTAEFAVVPPPDSSVAPIARPGTRIAPPGTPTAPPLPPPPPKTARALPVQPPVTDTASSDQWRVKAGILGLVAILAAVVVMIWPWDEAPLKPAVPRPQAPSAAKPTLAITSPAEGSVGRDREVIIEGQVSPASVTSLWISGRRLDVKGGHFWGTLNLDDGRHVLAVSLTPQGEPLASITIHVDSVPPLISVDTPKNGEALNVELLPIRGTVTDTHFETMQLADGTQVEVSENGAFDLVYELPDNDGEVSIELIARDSLNHEARRTMRVVVDRTPPELILEQEIQLAARLGADVTLRGRVEDAHPAVLYVDGQRNPLKADGSFSVTLEEVTEGTRNVVLQAEDGAGLLSPEQTVTIIGDDTPPRLLLDAPSTGLVTREAEITVKGRVEDEHSEVRLTVQGQSVPLAPDGSFSMSVPVNEGETRIELVVRDSANNSARLIRQVIRDSTPPIIALDSQLEPVHYGRSRIELTGHLDEPGCTLTLNGKPIEMEAGRFTATVRFKIGLNTVVLEATDPAGNVARQETPVQYARTKPKLPPGTWWTPPPAQLAHAKRTKLPLWFENQIGMKFVLIPPGRFLPPGKKEVSFPNGFYLGAHEVTNAQGKLCFNVSNQSGKYSGLALDAANQPQVNIAWDGANWFPEWLTDHYPTVAVDTLKGMQGRYRIPIEAEWEYACRAGTTTEWFWGSDAGRASLYANVADPVTAKELWTNEERQRNRSFPKRDKHRVTGPVGSYRPNPWGLYDMIGNVGELCTDWFVPNAIVNQFCCFPGPHDRSAGNHNDTSKTVYRGGSWRSSSFVARNIGRHYQPREAKGNETGIRILLEIKEAGRR